MSIIRLDTKKVIINSIWKGKGICKGLQITDLYKGKIL